jgi:predicted DNA-binding protein
MPSAFCLLLSAFCFLVSALCGAHLSDSALHCQTIGDDVKMATDRISIRVNPQLRRGLHEQASLNGKTDSDVVREALESYLVERGSSFTCYDLALKAGLIGAARNAPRDLSTSRKHFRGFGGSKRGNSR